MRVAETRVTEAGGEEACGEEAGREEATLVRRKPSSTASMRWRFAARPAQALRTSKKTGGLNSRPSCVRDGVCVLSLGSPVALRVSLRPGACERPFRGPRHVRRAKHVRLVPQPSRDDVARALCGDCYVGGTLLPAWTFTSGIASPAFTMAATERERFAAGGSVLLLYGPRVPHSTSNVSHLKERLC